MREFAEEITRMLKVAGLEGAAFALLVFPPGGGNVDYISNASRADMLTAMKEFINRAEGSAFIESKEIH